MMNAISKNSIPTDGEIATHFVGRLLKSTECGWIVEGSDGRYFSQVAVSCVLAPREQDRVLVCAAGEECWILCILDRNVGGDSLLEFSGDLTLRSVGGKVGLEGGKGVSISSQDEISLESPKISVTARLADVLTERLSWVGQHLDARFDLARFVGKCFDSVVDRFSRKSKRSYRTIEEVDQVRSNQIDYRADSNMTLRARNVLAKAEDLAKLDGNQIHLG